MTSPRKDPNGMPVVYVFGAGIAGLTVAHELIERGFAVRVVEAEADRDEEYTPRIGGLAANQYARTPADVRRLHPYLFEDDPDAETVAPQEARNSVTVWVTGPTGGGVKLRFFINDASYDVDVGGLQSQDIVGNTIHQKLRPPAIPNVTVDPETAGNFRVLVFKHSDASRLLRVRISEVKLDGTEEPSTLVIHEDARPLAELRELPLREAQRRFPLAERIQFRDPSVGWQDFPDHRGVSNRMKLDRVWDTLKRAYSTYATELARLPDLSRLSARMRVREELRVEIRGHAVAGTTSAANVQLSRQWAEAVRDELDARNAAVTPNPIPGLDARLVLVPVGDRKPLGAPGSRTRAERSNRVELRIVENEIPGEHGYRFFPCFYRHLFDTMRRTPILDDDGYETPETAFDQLRATGTVDLALPYRSARTDPIEIPVRRPRSLEGLRERIAIHLDPDKLGVTPRDVARFQVRLLKFLTSGGLRRRDFEKESWWRFLGGAGYSANMARVLREAPQALVAMDAFETDARSQGVNYVQLLLDWLGDAKDVNYTLNGPTSNAWLRYWKRYLVRQGVRFFVGTLSHLVWVQGSAWRLIPQVTLPDGQGNVLTVYVGSVSAAPYQLLVEGLPVTSAPGPDLESTVRQLAEGVHVIGVWPDARQARHGRLLLNSWWYRVDVLGPSGTSRTLRVNGEQFVSTDAGMAAREKIVAAITADLDVHVERVADASLRLAPRLGDVVISIVTDLAREYGVRIDGQRMLYSKRPGETLQQIRDGLRASIEQRRPGLARPLGRTGIRLEQPGTIDIDVDLWSPGVRLGLDVHGDLPGLQVEPDDIRVTTLDGRLGVVSAPQAEDPQQELEEDADFYVLAVPFEEASRLIWDAHKTRPPGEQLDGCFEQLRAFDKETARRDGNDTPVPLPGLPLPRDGWGRPYPAIYPLRDLSGIQYYFEHHVRVAPGHAYFEGAPWGLSSISQLAFWRERMSTKSAFLGQLSVDIGDFYAPRRVEPLEETTAPVHPSAWRSSKQAIAEEVWEQIKAGIREDKASKLVDPTYYHLDRGIEFADGLGGLAFGRLVRLRLNPLVSNGSLHVGGIEIVPATWDPGPVKTVIEADTPHLARVASTNEVVIAPVASGQKTVRVFVRSPVGGTYRVRVEAADWDPTSGVVHVASFMAQSGSTAEEIVDGLVGEIHQNIPGVIARREASTLVLELASADLEVSAIDPDGLVNPEDFAVDPCGCVEVRATGAVTVANPEEATPYRNATPFLINGPGVWRFRPGLWDPSKFPDPPFADGTPDVGYHLTKDRWVMVGNHMATHTRISTMESANESARHAVVAMLRAVSEDDARKLYHGGGKLLGDLPRIWDPEEHELDDLKPLRRLDDELHKKGLPHFLDILRIPELVDGMLEDLVLDDFDKQLQGLLSGAITTFEKDWSFTEADEIGKAMRAAIEALIKPSATS